MLKYIKNLDEISINDLNLVGGKSASLGEMINNLPHKIKIPPGFSITADAFSILLKTNNLDDWINEKIKNINFNNVEQLKQVALSIRSKIESSLIPKQLEEEILEAYYHLSQLNSVSNTDVSVRSSATAEDLPTASFAGQQETFLNIKGEESLLWACKKCFASLYTDRAIAYRYNKGFDSSQIRLSILVQQMVRADLGSSGIIFTMDPESGARNVIVINSIYGLGENIVGGRINPDEFLVQKDLLGKSKNPILSKKIGSKQKKLVYLTHLHDGKTTKNLDVEQLDQLKASISDDEIIQLASWSKLIEEYYSKINNKYVGMDIEWAKDGRNGELFILQARPETVHSIQKKPIIENYILKEKSKVLLTGISIGNKISSGVIKKINNLSELHKFKQGDILVTDMTDPDWEPIIKKASAIITNKGGRTCHAAIISREHGVPCVVGTKNATEELNDNDLITVDCSQGSTGFIYSGLLDFKVETTDVLNLKKNQTKLMVNLGNPAEAFKLAQFPTDGVGLARIEFVINNYIKIHPMALVNLTQLNNNEIKQEIIQQLGIQAENPLGFFVEQLTQGIATIAGAFYPRPVIVRFSDFKTNEYSNLLGGKLFEEFESNPMLGFRGAARYYHPKYQAAFKLECLAIKKAREEIGLDNIIPMIPFCRTVLEGKKVLSEMHKSGLIRGKSGLKIYLMAELPSNILEIDEFKKYFDGFSIGSNDLTQMILGVDRDSPDLCEIFNETDPAVLKMIKMLLEATRSTHPVGICGQAPSDSPEIIDFLITNGIDSISATSDSIFKIRKSISEIESKHVKTKEKIK